MLNFKKKQTLIITTDERREVKAKPCDFLKQIRVC